LLKATPALGNYPGAVFSSLRRPNPDLLFPTSHCGLPDGLYYLRSTDFLIRRNQWHAFGNGRSRDQPVRRVFGEAGR
jgi:hypothetical protein